ncbi:hypothetical protein NPIL_1171, partial [Nephila pilipes]
NVSGVKRSHDKTGTSKKKKIVAVPIILNYLDPFVEHMLKGSETTFDNVSTTFMSEKKSLQKVSDKMQKPAEALPDEETKHMMEEFVEILLESFEWDALKSSETTFIDALSTFMSEKKISEEKQNFDMAFLDEVIKHFAKDITKQLLKSSEDPELNVSETSFIDDLTVFMSKKNSLQNISEEKQNLVITLPDEETKRIVEEITEKFLESFKNPELTGSELTFIDGLTTFINDKNPFQNISEEMQNFAITLSDEERKRIAEEITMKFLESLKNPELTGSETTFIDGLTTFTCKKNSLQKIAVGKQNF